MVSPSRCPPWQPERPGPTRREPRRAQRSYTTPRDTIGLATSRDGGSTYEKYAQVPILDRRDGERVLRSAPHVRECETGWRMWYVSGNEFQEIDGKLRPIYGVSVAHSSDGLTWAGNERIVLKPAREEFGIGRPFVIHEDGQYNTWFSSRRRKLRYQLGFAVSRDGLSWDRRDDAVGLPKSTECWDSKMMCYAAIQPTSEATYLFYNGNDYGRTGVGFAVLADDTR